MIVLDASVLANIVGDDGAAGDIARTRVAQEEAIAIPDLAMVETVAALRRQWLAKNLDDQRFERAVEYLLLLPIEPFPVGPMMRRAFELRANLTAYDATYVALAEALDCTLVTADRRMANAPTISCHVEVLAV